MNYLEQIHSRFKGANFVHLCSPPPISDEDFLKDNWGQYFEKNKGRNFAPADLRMILYNMQSDIYASYAKKLNATFLQPPSSTLDGLGFLAREYWNIDPTHGNTAYGRLVLDQIKELKGDVAWKNVIHI